MGMYDYIRYVMDCPECGVEIDSFQSKDGDCCLATLEFWEVDRFYSTCQKCQTWIEYNRKRPTGKIPIKDYKRSQRKHPTTVKGE